MGALAKIRQHWKSFRFRAGAAVAGLPSPVKEYATGTEILSYDDLRERRLLAARDVASQVRGSRHATPEYPKANQLTHVGFMSNPVVRRCFDILCEHVIQAKLLVENGDGTRATSPVADRIRHLLEFPSGVEHAVRGGIGPHNWDWTLWRYAQDAYNTGNGMLEWAPGVGTDDPVQLRRMAPETTFIQPYPERDPRGYIEYYVITVGGIPYHVPPQNVLHMGFANPWSSFFGVPPLYSAIKPLGVDNELMNFTKTTLDNLGVPPYALEFNLKEIQDAGMSLNPYSVPEDRDGIEEVRDRFAALQNGPNRGKPAVAFGYKIKLLGMDMATLDAAGLVATSESRIYNVHGVPRALGGTSAHESDPKRQEIRVLRVHFLQGTVATLLQRIGGVIGPRIVSAFGPEAAGLRLRFDMSKIDVLREQFLRRGIEGAQVFRTGLHSRGTCLEMAGWPTHGLSEGQLSEFTPLEKAKDPATIPGAGENA